MIILFSTAFSFLILSGRRADKYPRRKLFIVPMKKKEQKVIIPDLREFTDDSGKKWVQTSTDDLFSIKELNEIITSIEKERAKDEVVFARIDFQKVDKEFYDTAVELQKRVQKQGKLLQKYAAETKRVIDRKNLKLKELIEYIKQLHQLIAQMNANPEDAGKIDFSAAFDFTAKREPEIVSIYEDVEEVVMKEGDKE
ncbi:MAG: hypothetical protein CVV49_13325 [Spirochaetae bacterium HGW-Spirochaetae-5]|nr:MAG: hypothetical protein CVV49_13325 [Spirochaetae bacterium HGW-Spirochaetae-5]